MLLEVTDLKTYYRGPRGAVHAVDGVSFSLEAGQNLGLVGESGCGKTTVAKSLIRVLGPNARIFGGEIRFKGRDLLKLPEARMRQVRWREIAMVPQSAMNALNPVYRVGDQVVETLQVHSAISASAARERAAELFALVGLERKRLGDYPHQLSGGMRQRVVIATALALDPPLILADEPTTALDVVVQDGILKQLQHVQERLGNSLILVTHDISVVAEMCQRVGVMYAGKIAEIGSARDVFKNASHPYTLGLLNAFPTLTSARGELISIPGSPPDLTPPPRGCRFAPRCPFVADRCREEDPPLLEIGPDHHSACHFPERAAEFRVATALDATWRGVAARLGEPAGSGTGRPAGGAAPDAQAAVEVVGLRRWFPLNRGLLAALLREDTKRVHALDGVSLAIRPGEILGLAGESGSGKSTLGEVVTGLQPPTAGEVRHAGRRVQRREWRAYRRGVQMVFQDPYETLNPRFTIQQAVAEPLRNFGVARADERLALVKKALRRAELSPPEHYLDRYPHELSGGQRQRVAIARAIALEPELLVADEPVSMLDVSIRAGVLNLLRRFRAELGTSILYISHDLATIRYLCDRTAVLYLGQVAEIGPTQEVVERPRHPYVELLLSAVPDPDPDARRTRVDARGEIPDPIDLPNGCRFHARCRYALPHCGWEGRDLLRLLEQRRLRADEAAATGESGGDAELDLVAEARTDGLDLVVRAREGRDTSALASYLERLMRSSERPSIRGAVRDTLVSGREVRVRFTRQPEPEFHRVTSDHLVACHLFTDGDHRPLAERRSD